MSPVEICTDPSASVSIFATVPFPAPGAPKRINFIPTSQSLIFKEAANIGEFAFVVKVIVVEVEIDTPPGKPL
jgi:hypothetical protein